jgi:hypothetical protein
MGGTLHRLEILLVGVVLLLAALVVAALTLLRPPTQGIYESVTPQPVATRTAVATPFAATEQGAVNSDIRGEATQPTRETTPAWEAQLAAAYPTLRVVWACLLISLSVPGLAYINRRHSKRRMAYTGQSVGMLLRAADGAVRASNLRVMRDLHARGQLSPELAAAAGLRRVVWWPQRALPPLALPTITIPHLRVPPLRLPRVRVRMRMPPVKRVLGRWDAAVREQRTAVETFVPAGADKFVSQAETTTSWEAEDLALAVAGVLADVWAECGLASQVLALDTRTGRGKGRVVVTIDVLVGDEARLAELPAILEARQPGWKARWQTARRGTAALTLDVAASGEWPARGPLLVPALTHGKGSQALRFFPLTTWRHLGIYGSGAGQALHAMLTSLLYTQPPGALAMAICDAGQVSPLYRDVAHLVPSPADLDQVAVAVAQALRAGQQTKDTRPVLLVVIEPDAERLTALTSLIQQARSHTGAPLHLVLVQEHVRPEGHELYALLPALITGEGRGNPALLPGQHEWPGDGEARFVGRGMRVEGRTRTIDEGTAAALLAPLRKKTLGLPPVLWETDTSTAAHAEEPIEADQVAEPRGTLLDQSAWCSERAGRCSRGSTKWRWSHAA